MTVAMGSVGWQIVGFVTAIAAADQFRVRYTLQPLSGTQTVAHMDLPVSTKAGTTQFRHCTLALCILY